MSTRKRVSTIIISALFPGVGQFIQRRYLAGGIILAAFGVALLGLLICAFRILADFYGMGFNFQDHEPSDISVRPLGVFFLLAIVIYLVNLVDAYRGHLRGERKEPGERLWGCKAWGGCGSGEGGGSVEDDQAANREQ